MKLFTVMRAKGWVLEKKAGLRIAREFDFSTRSPPWVWALSRTVIMKA